jgi:hypothetical protein
VLSVKIGAQWYGGLQIYAVSGRPANQILLFTFMCLVIKLRTQIESKETEMRKEECGISQTPENAEVVQ